MSDFIPLGDKGELSREGIKFEDIGQAPGYLGLGRKVYLVFEKGCWGVKSLNIFERIARYFGAFAFENTHWSIVEGHLKNPLINNRIKESLDHMPHIKDKIIRLIENPEAQIFPVLDGSSKTSVKPAPTPREPQGQQIRHDASHHVASPKVIDQPPSCKDQGLIDLFEKYGTVQAVIDKVFEEGISQAAILQILEAASVARPVNEGFVQILNAILNSRTGAAPAQKQAQPAVAANPLEGAQAPKMAKHSAIMPIYDLDTHRFADRDPRTEKMAIKYQEVLHPKTGGKDIVQYIASYGDWEEFGYNGVKAGVELREGSQPYNHERIMVDNPELGNYLYCGVLGNGGCGYNAAVVGLIHGHCILHDQIDELKQKFQTSYDELIGDWNRLPFENDTQKSLFINSLNTTLRKLNEIKHLSLDARKAKLNDHEFIRPLLNLISCEIASVTKKIIEESKINKMKDDPQKINKMSLIDFYVGTARNRGVPVDQFIKQKALQDKTNIDQIDFWLQEPELHAINYALNINIGILQPAGPFGLKTKTFEDRDADCYAINTAGPHFDVLVPAF